jgi:large subunit ribosomal protein L6
LNELRFFAAIKTVEINFMSRIGKQPIAIPPKVKVEVKGQKVSVDTGKVVNLSLGYSHPVNYDIPDQIKVTVEENTKLTIEGPDKMMVGKVASEIRAFYPPEPYKGKGVRYVGEHVERKEGKTVQ